MHYRRFFTLNSIKKYHKFDLTIADSYIYPNVQQQFKDYHKSNDLDYVYNEVITQYPEYKNKIDIYLSGQKSYFFNMFIMKKELFFEYCNFVFPILLKLYKMPKYHQQSERNQRMIAFIAERLSGMFFSIKIQENIKVNISEILRCDTDKKISYAVKKFNNNFVQQKLTKIFEYMHYKYCKILSKLTYGAISKNYKNKYEGWVLPKGTVEEGEEFQQTALREVLEESGSRASIIKYVGKSEYTFNVPEDVVEKEVHWYLMMADSYYSKPQREEYFVDSGFYKYHEAYHLLKFANEKQILEKAYHEYLELKKSNLWGSHKYY